MSKTNIWDSFFIILDSFLFIGNISVTSGLNEQLERIMKTLHNNNNWNILRTGRLETGGKKLLRVHQGYT